MRSLAGAHKSDMVQDCHKQRVLQSEVKVGYIAAFQQTRPEHLGKQLRFPMEDDWDFICCTSDAIWDAGITWTRQPAFVFAESVGTKSYTMPLFAADCVMQRLCWWRALR